MKTICIPERFRPFSHQPGIFCLIPGTRWSFQAFPTLLRFFHGKNVIECFLHLTGPVEQFTLQQDLERRVIFVFGQAKEGYFRLRLEAHPYELKIYAEKVFPQGLSTSLGKLFPKESLSIPMEWIFYKPLHIERLFLGSHKEQKWEALSSSWNLKEVLPLLFLLAQQTPPLKLSASLYFEMQNESSLRSFLKAHFTSMLVPRFFDDHYQGIQMASVDFELDKEPSALLYETFQNIRSSLIRQEESAIFLLPALPSTFECGKFIDIDLKTFGKLDLEWTKSSLRRAIFRSEKSGTLSFFPPPSIKSFRVKADLTQKGLCQKINEPFMVKAGGVYYLDRFER